jgi:4a-hydroxytetrahydrobiopterin dehydratase
VPYAPLLNDGEIQAALDGLPEWTREGDVIVRTVRCATFREAVGLVDAVADAAEAADHHPDIELVWRRVTFRLTSKASGGLTARDMEIAATIDRLASEPKRAFREAFPIIQAPDVERLVRFYVEAFEFDQAFRFPDEGPLEYAYLKLRPLGIGIGRRPPEAGAPPDDRGWELWIYAEDADDAVRRAAAAGASVLEEPADQPWGERVALVADPEGNRIRIGAVLDKGAGRIARE